MGQKRQSLRASHRPHRHDVIQPFIHHQLGRTTTRVRAVARASADNNGGFRYRMRRPERCFGRAHKERQRAEGRGHGGVVCCCALGRRISLARLLGPNPQRARFGLQRCLGQRVTASTSTGVWQLWHSRSEFARRMHGLVGLSLLPFHASLAPVVSLACCRARTQEPRPGTAALAEWHGGGRGLLLLLAGCDYRCYPSAGLTKACTSPGPAALCPARMPHQRITNWGLRSDSPRSHRARNAAAW